jgi:hypothetical protein
MADTLRSVASDLIDRNSGSLSATIPGKLFLFEMAHLYELKGETAMVRNLTYNEYILKYGNFNKCLLLIGAQSKLLRTLQDKVGFFWMQEYLNDPYILIGGIYVDDKNKQHRVTIWYDSKNSRFITSNLKQNIVFDFSQTYVSVSSKSLGAFAFNIKFTRFDLVYDGLGQNYDGDIRNINLLIDSIEILNKKYKKLHLVLKEKTSNVINELQTLNIIPEIKIQCNDGYFTFYPMLIAI